MDIRVQDKSRLGRTTKRTETSSKDGVEMNIRVLQEWTEAQVPMKYGDNRHVRYKVFQNGAKLFQEIRDVDDELIHMLELPRGMAMNQSSYEVLLRYVLTDVVNS